MKLIMITAALVLTAAGQITAQEAPYGLEGALEQLGSKRR